jgi:putative ABC transport system permease protein
MKQYLRLLPISLAAMTKARWASLTIVFCFAALTLVLQGFLAMIAGFEQAANNTGAADIAIFLDAQATSENSSNVTREQLDLVRGLPALRGTDGRVELAGELTAIASGVRSSDKTRINLTVRGIDADSVHLRRGFRLIAGRLPRSGTREVAVGRRLAGEVEGITLGKPVRLRNSDWLVVGVFALEGNLFESEIWANLDSVQDAFNRLNQFQSIRIRLPSQDALAHAAAASADDPRLGLQVMSERDYLQAQAASGVFLVKYFGWPMTLVLAVGVVSGVYNIIQITILARARANAILLQIGFRRAPLFASLLSETVLLALTGAALGALAAWVLLDGMVTSTLGVGFTTRTFSLEITPLVVLPAFALAAAVGILSGVGPSWRGVRAAR